jgi:sortase A
VRRLFLISTELLITLCVLVAGFVAYLYWGSAIRTSSAQHAYARELGRQWSADDPLAGLTSLGQLSAGRPFALLRIPQFGAGWQFAVVQGTEMPELAVAPGHVPGTALPGQIGNFAVAGLRITAPDPFWRLPSLRTGSMIDVETINGTYEYEVTTKPALMPSDDLAMLAPVPYHASEQASTRMITLVTCEPPWPAISRVIVTGVLVRTLPRPLGS